MRISGLKFDCAFAIRPDDAFEAQSQCRRVAGERQFDGFAGQRLALAGEQQPGSAVDMVAAAARPAGGIARPAPGEPPAPVPYPLFPLFYLVEIRHRQLLQRQSRTRSGCRCPQGYSAIIAIQWLSMTLSQDRRCNPVFHVMIRCIPNVVLARCY